MQGILVDSNVIIDIFTQDKNWYQWSSETLYQHAEQSQLHINIIIYAEVSLAFDNIEDLEKALPEHYFQRSEIPWEAAFLAGKAFLKYRRQGGGKSLPLPDFFIGAHASISGFTVLTRDPKPFNGYYPKLKIISPSSSH